MPSRRRVLAGLGTAAAAALTGCAGAFGSGEPAGEGGTREVIVVNATDAVARIGVRLEDDGGTALFSRVYRLDPGTTDESAGIDVAPTTVHAFTPTGAAATWDYDPDLDCAGPDVGLTLAGPTTIESWYGC